MHKYPGLRPHDMALWDMLLLSHPGLFKEVWYNIKLGDPVTQERDREIMLRTGMYDVSSWVVDVLARDEENYYVIEIKPDAKAGAIGQALAYKALLESEYTFTAPLYPVVLTDDIGPITQTAAQLLGVTVMTP